MPFKNKMVFLDVQIVTNLGNISFNQINQCCALLT